MTQGTVHPRRFWSKFANRSDAAAYIKVFGSEAVGYGFGEARGSAPGKALQWHPFYITIPPVPTSLISINNVLHFGQRHLTKILIVFLRKASELAHCLISPAHLIFAKQSTSLLSSSS